MVQLLLLLVGTEKKLFFEIEKKMNVKHIPNRISVKISQI